MLRAGAAAAALLFLLLSLLPASRCDELHNNATYTYSSFNDSNRDFLAVLGDAGISQGALQLTPDSSNQASTYLVNKAGRILLKQPFKLWEPSAAAVNRVASFDTSFTINVYWPNASAAPGEGLAFLIAPSADDPPAGSSGGYLGLTNSTLDSSPANRFVAIELDTVQQSYDPDANHVGLNINSVHSNMTASLTPLGIEIAPLKPANYTVWISYDGVARHVWVYVAREGQPRPARAALNASLDLSKHLAQTSYFGFAGSTGADFELNCVLAWNLTIERLSDDGKSGGGSTAQKVALGVGLPSAAVAAVVVGIIAARYLKRKRVRDYPSALAGTLKSLPGMPKEFSFKELKRATNNFDEAQKLGQGGFGVVYKGVLNGDTNAEVAVKMFSRGKTKGQDDFLAELSIINRLRHKHLVRLVGWCHRNGVLLLVYDFMPNGSLDQHLFGGPDKPLLSWERRYNVVAGVASALHYLHNEYDQKVVHRDLKASNVMLDAAFNARLGDFGLARALDTDKTSYAEIELGGVPGTLGYVAPECFHTGKATRESDVFGFGAVVLEVVCGRRPRCDVGGFQFLADWVWKLHREGRILDAVDPRLAADADCFVAEEAERLLLLGLACSHPTPADRPKTQAIVQIISGSVPPPVVPPFKPSFVWPSYCEDDRDGGATTQETSSVVNSSCYASSSVVWTPQCVSPEINDDVSIV